MTDTPIDLGDVAVATAPADTKPAPATKDLTGLQAAQAKLEAQVAKAQAELQALHALSQLGDLDKATRLAKTEFYVQVVQVGSSNFHVKDMNPSAASWMPRKFYIDRKGVAKSTKGDPVAFKVTIEAIGS